MEAKDFKCYGPSGCNHCGGIVSESLIQLLSAEGIVLPSEVIQQGIESYTLHLEQGSTVITAPFNEQRIAALENGAGAIATSSGMSAISTVLFSLTEKDDEIVSSKSLFGGTFLFFNNVLKKYGVNIKYVEATDIDAYEKAITEKTRLIFLETIGNPKLDVPDIKRLSTVARNHNIPLVVDSTLTTPYLFDAKAHGADIAIHSATKYIAGNGSAIGGVIVDCGNFDWKKSQTSEISEAAKKVHPKFAFLKVARKNIIQNVGACPSPFNVYLQNLGLETLSLRMDRHCQNALELAQSLSGCSEVASVNYPGLKDNKFHDLSEKQFKGKFGGLLTFRLNSREECFKLIDSLRVVKNMANLGDTRTLIVHPASTIFHECTEAEMEAAGVSDDMVRVSVGIENITDIINDFKQALEETKK